MAIPKEKKPERVAGRKKFELPPREPRPASDNPVRDLLLAANERPGPVVEARVIPLVEPPSPETLIETAPPVVEGERPKTARKTNRMPRMRPSGEAGRARAPVIERGASFKAFRQKYGRLLGKSRLSICETLFDLTHGLGQFECLFSIKKIAEATGFSERYIFKLVGQLEDFGFIEKVEIFNTANKKGTVYRLHLEPLLK